MEINEIIEGKRSIKKDKKNTENAEKNAIEERKGSIIEVEICCGDGLGINTEIKP